MTVRMLINAATQNELRIAVVEDGELVDLDIESAEETTIRGNVYKGVVQNVEDSLGAAFIDIGGHKQGFLPFYEIDEDSYHVRWDKDEEPRISQVIRKGEEIVVQVAKDAVGDKGATLTTYLSLAGRYTVLMPGRQSEGISRKADEDSERQRIRSLIQEIDKPEDCGFIIRTAGLDQEKEAIQKDLDTLTTAYRKVQDASKIARAPSVLYAEPDLISRTLRDYFTDDIEEVLIDDKGEFEGAKGYFDDVMPDYAQRLHSYQNPIPIFAYYHVEEQIEETFERQVKMPSGGSIVIDETEALVAIDVNSGSTSEGSHEETVFKTNCEAAETICRQLRLRDLGGIIVIDFIDMERTENKRKVEKVLEEFAEEDKARYKISRINSKGLCILTRQRIRQGMRKAFQKRCEVCSGTGWRRTPESHSISLLRRIETRLAQGGVGQVEVETHRNTAEYLLNRKRKELLALEQRYNCKVIVTAKPFMDRGNDECRYLSKGELLAEITDKLPPREERRPRKKKRRRKKPKAKAESKNNESSNSEGRKKAPKRRKKSSSKSEPQQHLEDGQEPKTTFTGKPPPEMMKRIREERKARQARLSNNNHSSSTSNNSANNHVGAERRGEEAAAKDAAKGTFLSRLLGKR